MIYIRFLMILVALTNINQCISDETVYYVSITGNDLTGDGSPEKPWRTLSYSVNQVRENSGFTVKLSPGTFVEKGFIKVPPGVNIAGAGMSETVLQPDSVLFFTVPEWRFDKFLINLSGDERGMKQELRDFAIDGASKQLFGGILVKDRSNVLLQNVSIQHTYYTGIWMWNTTDCRVTQVKLKDCAWGSSEGASASIILSIGERLAIDHCDIDEKYGQALEAKPTGKMHNLKIHDNKFSVSPEGQWKTPGGQRVPNLAVEFYNVELKGCLVYNNYFDNTLSIAMDDPKYTTPTGIQTIRVHNNTFDLINRAAGSGYGIELTLHDAEIDHNYFYGGFTGIVNWDASANAHTMHNWKIHHNIFYKFASFYPSAVIRLFRNGVSNADIYNNTIELADTSTINFIEVNNGGIAYNVNINNNLIINSSTDYNWYPNKLIHVINDGSFKKSFLANNSFTNLQVDSVPGLSFSNNIIADPKIQKQGKRPVPYYNLTPGSPLIDKGSLVTLEYLGDAPDIGALELDQSP